MSIDESIVGRDIGFFLIFFALAAAGTVNLPAFLNIAAAVILVVAYVCYVIKTLGTEGGLAEVPEKLIFWRASSAPPEWMAAVQMLAALAVMVGGAHLFVVAIEAGSAIIGIPAGLISLIRAPLATELPEKFNSIFWVRDDKDTLAMGNITGAMVFQSTIPVSLGVLFTPWDLDVLSLVSVLLALLSSGFLYVMLRRRKSIQAWQLMLGGSFYAVFIAAAVITVM